MALVNPLNVTLYQVGDLVNTQWTSFNNFLDSLDETYCSRDGQTENVTAPIIDAIYPSKLPGGFAGPRNCGGWVSSLVSPCILFILSWIMSCLNSICDSFVLTPLFDTVTNYSLIT